VITEVKTQHSILPHAAYERPLHSFSHIFAGGYAAGYYSYLWAEILACDAFQRFRDEGLFNPDTGKAFLQCILARGGSRPIQESFRDFRGQDATPEAFLDHHGIH
jgi:oligopeptidase A